MHIIGAPNHLEGWFIGGPGDLEFHQSEAYRRAGGLRRETPLVEVDIASRLQHRGRSRAHGPLLDQGQTVVVVGVHAHRIQPIALVVLELERQEAFPALDTRRDRLEVRPGPTPRP